MSHHDVQQHDIKIDKWVYGGEGLSRIEGRVVLVPHVLPGETVRIDAGKDVHASLVEVLTPAAERVPAPCPLFTVCGGCHYQHAPYEYQLARKVEILREQLLRVGKIKFEGEIGVISGPPLGISQPGAVSHRQWKDRIPGGAFA